MKKNRLKPIAALALSIGMLIPLFACVNGEETPKGLVISEVVSSNGTSYEDEAHGSPDWIELHNESDQPINLFGWGVTDNIKNADKTCYLPEVTIPADGYLLLLATKQEKTDALKWDGVSPICLGFSLKAAGEELVLINANMQAVSELTVPELGHDVSYARRENGTYGYCAVPTPGAANSSEITDKPPVPEQETYRPVTGVEISEVSARNASLSCGGCDSCDWIELHNTTGTDIPLEGFTLCDDPSDFDDENLHAVLPANGYLVLFCCSADCATKDEHPCVDLGISRNGDHLYLYDAHGQLCTELSVPATQRKDATYARRENGTYGFCLTPTPGEANTAEILDELPPEPTEAPENSGDDAQKDPTEGAVRPTVIRISEALAKNAYSITDRDGDRSDWVELYNTSDETVSLAGRYLSDNPNNLVKWAFPADASIDAHGYLIVFLSGKTDVSDQLHAGFSLGTGETLFLYNEADHTLDWVTIPELKDNISVGLDGNNEQVYYRWPTPGEANGHAEKDGEAIGFFSPDGVYISEVCAIHDRGSSENDWIELYNGGTSAVSLDGWYVSDSIDEPTKYRISSLSIPANGYAVVETSASEAKRSAGAGTFGISPGGETLFLSDPQGVVQDLFETGVQRNGMSSGRKEGDEQTRRVFFTAKTKGEPNSAEAYRGYAAQPVFSENALYQSAPFSLTLSSSDPDARIYYTTDGSEPDGGSTLYSGPISVSQNAVVRAVAIVDGLLKSEIATRQYLFEQPHTLPIVCIAMAPNDLKTVYQVKEHSKIQERKGFVSYYESDGRIGTQFPCDIKAKGRGTLKFISQKSLTLSLRGAYGMSSVEYPFFPDYPFTDFSAFALRQAGQDYDTARLRDAFVSRACVGLNVDCANSRFCVVYINGQYYGIHDFNEELNSKYLETHFGVDSDTVNTIMRNGATAMKGTNTEFKQVFNAAKNKDLSSDAAYEEFCKKVDPDAFIDYVICRQFMVETDSFNQKYWRTTDYRIRWRPILYDLDYCFFSSGANRNVAHLYFNKEGTPSKNGSMTYFYFSVALRTNPGWRQRFIERYVELAMTQFSAERLTALLDQVVSELEPEMARHIARWGHPKSVSAWKSNVESLRKNLEKRPELALEHIRKEFKVSESEMNELIAKYQNP